MSENSCCDQKMERFRLVLRSFNEGGTFEITSTKKKLDNGNRYSGDGEK